MRYNTEQLAEICGGRIASGGAGAEVRGISTDSRTVKAGELFIPLVGEKFDGHDFLVQAFENGASCALFSRGSEDLAYAFELLSAKGLETDMFGVISVDDTLTAMQRLAKRYLDELPRLKKRFGVTGSTGKTSTKELLYKICASKYRTGKSEKNYNGDIGLPMTILGLPEDIEVAVLEMGMDKPGEIAKLAELAKPDVALITNVRTTHIEHLGSRENIFREKISITSAFGKDGVLVINADEDLLTRESAAGPYRLVSCGRDGRNDYIVSGIEDYGEDGIAFSLEHGGELAHFRLHFPGRHNADNAALAVAAAAELGISMEEAAAALSEMEMVEDRLSIKGYDGVKLIDDFYNASPDSTKAAIDVLAATKGIRKLAILSDMKELAGESERYHLEVGRYLGEKGIDALVTIGEDSIYYGKGALPFLGEENIRHFANADEFLAEYGSLVRKGDVVLVKGSHFFGIQLGMGRIIGRIKQGETWKN